MTPLLPEYSLSRLDTVHVCKALTLLNALPDASISLIATDPPYNGVKDAAWDNQWDTDAAYLDWLRTHLREMRRVLQPNGSLYLFASPRMAARVELAVGEYFNVLNQVVWNKQNGNANWRANKEAILGYLPNTERIIFAEQFESTYSWTNAADGLRGSVFEPIRAYLDGERLRAGVSFEDVRQMVGCASGSGLPSHWFTRSQWALPTAEHYLKLQVGFNAKGNGDYLRREYEDLRRPFNSSPYAPYTDVWTFRTVQAYEDKHECEKPLDLMRHIVSMSSRPGDTVLDCFAGSGATLDAARQEGRHYIGCDMSTHWVGEARKRLAQPYMLPLFAQAEAVNA